MHPFQEFPEPARSALRTESSAVASIVGEAIRASGASRPAALLGLLIAFVGTDALIRQDMGAHPVSIDEAVRQSALGYEALGETTDAEFEVARVLCASGAIPEHLRADSILGRTMVEDGEAIEVMDPETPDPRPSADPSSIFFHKDAI